MSRKLVCILAVQSLICKVFSHGQPVHQYFHLTGIPNPAQATNAFSIPQSITHNPINPNPIPTPIPPNPKPVTGLSTIPGLSIPTLCLESQKSISNDKSSQQTPIDTTLLNNLAIALQLLIVSNILNMPSEVKEMQIELAELSNQNKPCYNRIEVPQSITPQQTYVELPSQNGPYYQPGYVEVASQIPPYYYQQQEPVLSNANYLGGAVFKESLPGKARVIKSPYEVLSPNSYSDSYLSQFETANLKRDFVSPYTMFSDTKDVFSINDLL